MTYQELINNIRDLGFSDDAEMAEFGEKIYNDINRSISEINVEFAHIKKKYEFEIESTDTEYLYITMPEVDANFLDFVDNPVTFATVKSINSDGEKVYNEIYKIFGSYQIETGDTLVINPNGNAGKIRVFYNAAHEPFLSEAQLSDEIPLPLNVHHLVPLLASYYIWLEDEPVKAAQYYNLYEQKKASYVLNTERPRMRVLEGGL